MLAALERALTEFVADCDGCRDPRTCDHPANRAHPAELFEWIRLRLEPPELSEEYKRLDRPLSQDRRARWARRHRAELRAQRLVAAS